MIMTKDEHVTDHYDTNTRIPTATDPTPLWVSVAFVVGLMVGMIIFGIILGMVA